MTVEYKIGSGAGGHAGPQGVAGASQFVHKTRAEQVGREAGNQRWPNISAQQ